MSTYRCPLALLVLLLGCVRGARDDHLSLGRLRAQEVAEAQERMVGEHSAGLEPGGQQLANASPPHHNITINVNLHSNFTSAAASPGSDGEPQSSVLNITVNAKKSDGSTVTEHREVSVPVGDGQPAQAPVTVDAPGQPPVAPPPAADAEEPANKEVDEKTMIEEAVAEARQEQDSAPEDTRSDWLKKVEEIKGKAREKLQDIKEKATRAIDALKDKDANKSDDDTEDDDDEDEEEEEGPSSTPSAPPDTPDNDSEADEGSKEGSKWDKIKQKFGQLKGKAKDFVKDIKQKLKSPYTRSRRVDNEAPISTTLSQAAKAGDTTLNVSSQEGFEAGSQVTISGDGKSENRTIASLGPIVLTEPLENSYPEGAEVTGIIEVCRAYMQTTGCNWTALYNCPTQPSGIDGAAADDGTLGYDCCCNQSMWRDQEEDIHNRAFEELARRREEKEKKQKEEAAATKIQSVVRGMEARRAADELRAAGPASDKEETSSTVTMYRVGDMYRVNNHSLSDGCGQFVAHKDYQAAAQTWLKMRVGLCSDVGYTKWQGNKTLQLPVIGQAHFSVFKKAENSSSPSAPPAKNAEELVEQTFEDAVEEPSSVVSLYKVRDLKYECGQFVMDKKLEYIAMNVLQMKEGHCKDEDYTETGGTKNLTLPGVGQVQVTLYKKAPPPGSAALAEESIHMVTMYRVGDMYIVNNKPAPDACGEFVFDSRLQAQATTLLKMTEGRCSEAGYETAQGTKVLDLPIIGEVGFSLYLKAEGASPPSLAAAAPTKSAEELAEQTFEEAVEEPSSVVSLYKVRDNLNECGQFVLDKKLKSIAVKVLHMREGHCNDEGYTETTGIRSFAVPQVGQVEITLYQKAGASSPAAQDPPRAVRMYKAGGHYTLDGKPTPDACGEFFFDSRLQESATTHLNMTEGRCSEAGYDTFQGMTTHLDLPIIGQVQFTLYTKATGSDSPASTDPARLDPELAQDAAGGTQTGIEVTSPAIFPEGSRVMISQDGKSEVRTIDRVSHAKKGTSAVRYLSLSLTEPLEHSYRAGATVKLVSESFAHGFKHVRELHYEAPAPAPEYAAPDSAAPAPGPWQWSPGASSGGPSYGSPSFGSPSFGSPSFGSPSFDEACESYTRDTGCGWTARHNCPDQPSGTIGPADDDGTLGYDCCCNQGFWKMQDSDDDEEAEDSSTAAPSDQGADAKEKAEEALETARAEEDETDEGGDTGTDNQANDVSKWRKIKERLGEIKGKAKDVADDVTRKVESHVEKVDGYLDEKLKEAERRRAATEADDQAPVTTALSQPAEAGDHALNVVSQDGFQAGSQVTISGDGNSENRTIASSLGPIVLTEPLENSYPVGATVTGIVEVCSSYMQRTGCSWTALHNCPGQPSGATGAAADDGTLGYDCCCNQSMWKEQEMEIRNRRASELDRLRRVEEEKKRKQEEEQKKQKEDGWVNKAVQAVARVGKWSREFGVKGWFVNKMRSAGVPDDLVEVVERLRAEDVEKAEDEIVKVVKNPTPSNAAAAMDALNLKSDVQTWVVNRLRSADLPQDLIERVQNLSPEDFEKAQEPVFKVIREPTRANAEEATRALGIEKYADDIRRRTEEVLEGQYVGTQESMEGRMEEDQMNSEDSSQALAGDAGTTTIVQDSDLLGHWKYLWPAPNGSWVEEQFFIEADSAGSPGAYHYWEYCATGGVTRGNLTADGDGWVSGSGVDPTGKTLGYIRMRKFHRPNLLKFQFRSSPDKSWSAITWLASRGNASEASAPPQTIGDASKNTKDQASPPVVVNDGAKSSQQPAALAASRKQVGKIAGSWSYTFANDHYDKKRGRFVIQKLQGLSDAYTYDEDATDGDKVHCSLKVDETGWAAGRCEARDKTGNGAGWLMRVRQYFDRGVICYVMGKPDTLHKFSSSWEVVYGFPAVDSSSPAPAPEPPSKFVSSGAGGSPSYTKVTSTKDIVGTWGYKHMDNQTYEFTIKRVEGHEDTFTFDEVYENGTHTESFHGVLKLDLMGWASGRINITSKGDSESRTWMTMSFHEYDLDPRYIVAYVQGPNTPANMWHGPLYATRVTTVGNPPASSAPTSEQGDQAKAPPSAPAASPVDEERPMSEACFTYLRDTGCRWTAQRNCPDQPSGTQGAATDDGGLGYDCCCKSGLWKTRQQEPSGAPASAPGRIAARAGDAGVLPEREACTSYMTDTGCNWTAQHNCPDQPAGTVGAASDDGTLGHACCCKHGLWKTQEKPTSASAESKWSKLKQNVKKKLNNFKARVFAQEPEAPQTPAAPEVPPAVNAPLTADDVSDQIPAPPKVVDSMRALMEVSEHKVVDSMRALMEVSEHKAEEARVVEDRTDALDTIEQKSEEGAKNAAAELAKADAQLQATAKDAKDEKQPAVQAWLHGSQSEAVQPSQHAQFEASLKGVASTLP